MFTNRTYFKCLGLFSFSTPCRAQVIFSCKKKNMVQLQIVLISFVTLPLPLIHIFCGQP